MNSKAYIEGSQARALQLDTGEFSYNPYTRRTQAYYDWEKGWNDYSS